MARRTDFRRGGLGEPLETVAGADGSLVPLGYQLMNPPQQAHGSLRAGQAAGAGRPAAALQRAPVPVKPYLATGRLRHTRERAVACGLRPRSTYWPGWRTRGSRRRSAFRRSTRCGRSRPRPTRVAIGRAALHHQTNDFRHECAENYGYQETGRTYMHDLTDRRGLRRPAEPGSEAGLAGAACLRDPCPATRPPASGSAPALTGLPGRAPRGPARPSRGHRGRRRRPPRGQRPPARRHRGRGTARGGTPDAPRPGTPCPPPARRS